LLPIITAVIILISTASFIQGIVICFAHLVVLLLLSLALIKPANPSSPGKIAVKVEGECDFSSRQLCLLPVGVCVMWIYTRLRFSFRLGYSIGPRLAAQ